MPLLARRASSSGRASWLLAPPTIAFAFRSGMVAEDSTPPSAQGARISQVSRKIASSPDDLGANVSGQGFGPLGVGVRQDEVSPFMRQDAGQTLADIADALNGDPATG